MTKLSVNVNKLATIRNARGKNNPDVLATSLDIVKFGAQGITVHPRPDERHIRRSDVYALKNAVTTVEFNIEGYPSDDFIAMVCEVKPQQATLVPDPPEALTSNAGWRVGESEGLLKKVSSKLNAAGVRVSVFVDPETMAIGDYATLKRIGVDRVELYTEKYAETYGTAENQVVLKSYVHAAELARDVGLGINAGHDLNTENLPALIAAIPWLDEVSIGHALICDALYWGLNETVKRYLKCIEQGEEAARVSDRR
jgi:pyridoxine 5-phosphate synthase